MNIIKHSFKDFFAFLVSGLVHRINDKDDALEQ